LENAPKALLMLYSGGNKKKGKLIVRVAREKGQLDSKL